LTFDVVNLNQDRTSAPDWHPEKMASTTRVRYAGSSPP